MRTSVGESRKALCIPTLGNDAHRNQRVGNASHANQEGRRNEVGISAQLELTGESRSERDRRTTTQPFPLIMMAENVQAAKSMALRVRVDSANWAKARIARKLAAARGISAITMAVRLRQGRGYSASAPQSAEDGTEETCAIPVHQNRQLMR